MSEHNAQPAVLLPKPARDLLVQASQADPRVRTRAVDEAIDRVKLLYPDYFHQEPKE